MQMSHSEEQKGASSNHRLGRLPQAERVVTFPYFSSARLAGFDATCDRGLAQMLYLHSLIEEDMAQIGGSKAAAAG